MISSDIHLRANSLRVCKLLFWTMCVKVILSELLPHPSGDNEWTQRYTKMLVSTCIHLALILEYKSATSLALGSREVYYQTIIVINSFPQWYETNLIGNSFKISHKNNTYPFKGAFSFWVVLFISEKSLIFNGYYSDLVWLITQLIASAQAYISFNDTKIDLQSITLLAHLVVNSGRKCHIIFTTY